MASTINTYDISDNALRKKFETLLTVYIAENNEIEREKYVENGNVLI
jgi:hypothetical protein